jgi:basic amino acid/polyamine antiporter, APA family
MALTDLFRRKSLVDAVGDSEQAQIGLRRTLSAADLTMLGIGAIIGAGLFSSIGDMTRGTTFLDGSVRTLGAGPGIMLSYLLTATACGFAALCYAEIAAMVPVAGSAYTYSYVAFGEVVAWIIGWDLIIEYAIGNVYVAERWADYFATFVKNVTNGFELPFWLTKDMMSLNPKGVPMPGAPQVTLPFFGDTAIGMNLPAIAITALLTFLLVLGVRESARFNAVMVVIKVGLILAFLAIGFGYIDAANWGSSWETFAPNGFKGIWQGAALGFFSYIGFDAVSTASEETKNPQKNIPRGMIWSLVICTVLYVATAAVLTGMVPWHTIGGEDPISAVFQAKGMKRVASMFAFGAMVAMTAVLLVFQLGQTRIFMTMSRDGLLPPAFGKLHPRFRTPHVGTIITGLIVALGCAIMDPDTAITLCNIGTLFAFLLVSIGVIVLRVREPDRPRPFKVPGYPFTPLISAAACIGLIIGLESSNWLRFLIWLGIGMVIYAFYGFWRSRLRARATPAR